MMRMIVIFPNNDSNNNNNNAALSLELHHYQRIISGLSSFATIATPSPKLDNPEMIL